MPHDASLLVQFSDALSALAAGARAFTAAVRTSERHRLSGVVWKPNAVVVSEQALSEQQDYEVSVGDQIVKAHLAGRDQGTNVAVLKPETDIAGQLPPPATAKVGALALVAGAAENGVSARLAIVRAVGDAWQSMAGGSIDQRIVLDSPIRAGEEGGPVLGADGAIFGISTRGAGRQSLVIPASTVERAVVALLQNGSVRRGWLGVSLKPVALPETLRPNASQRVGLMAMDVEAGSPAAEAGILAGDILLTAAGFPAARYGSITRQLGPDSIGKRIEFTVARAGATLTCGAVIAARKSG